jgi:hypothetical protein
MFDVDRCEIDMENVFTEVRSRFTNPPLLNATVSLSSSTVNGGRLSVAALDRCIRLITRLSKDFERGRITKVSVFIDVFVFNELDLAME